MASFKPLMKPDCQTNCGSLNGNLMAAIKFLPVLTGVALTLLMLRMLRKQKYVRLTVTIQMRNDGTYMKKQVDTF